MNFGDMGGDEYDSDDEVGFGLEGSGSESFTQLCSTHPIRVVW